MQESATKSAKSDSVPWKQISFCLSVLLVLVSIGFCLIFLKYSESREQIRCAFREKKALETKFEELKSVFAKTQESTLQNVQAIETQIFRLQNSLDGRNGYVNMEEMGKSFESLLNVVEEEEALEILSLKEVNTILRKEIKELFHEKMRMTSKTSQIEDEFRGLLKMILETEGIGKIFRHVGSSEIILEEMKNFATNTKAETELLRYAMSDFALMERLAKADIDIDVNDFQNVCDLMQQVIQTRDVRMVTMFMNGFGASLWLAEYRNQIANENSFLPYPTFLQYCNAHAIIHRGYDNIVEYVSQHEKQILSSFNEDFEEKIAQSSTLALLQSVVKQMNSLASNVKSEERRNILKQRMRAIIHA